MAQESEFRVELVPVGRLRKNPFNPRGAFEPEDKEEGATLEKLAASIKKDGILQPLIGRSLGANVQLALGERRRLASELAGVERVPVILRDLDDAMMRRYGLVENLHRLNLKGDEFVEAVGKIWEQDYGASDEVGTVRQIAKDLGLRETGVSEALTVYGKGHAVFPGKLQASVKMKAALTTLAEEAPEAARELTKAVKEGTLELDELREVIPIVRGAPEDKQLAVAKKVTRAAKVKSVAKGVVAREIERLRDREDTREWQKTLNQDERFLNRLADFLGEAERYDMTFLEMVGTKQARLRAIKVLEKVRDQVDETLERANRAMPRWEKEWKEA